jgi:alpha-beta hydrolase superfamily lysophospholipase
MDSNAADAGAATDVISDTMVNEMSATEPEQGGPSDSMASAENADRSPEALDEPGTGDPSADDSAEAPDAAPERSDDPAQPAVEPAQPAAVDDEGAFIRAPDWVPEDPAGHPLSIERLRGQSYPGSDLVVVQELPAGSNYSRAVATYPSEGLTIRGLLTIPNGERPASGWPVIIFNHGYIPPAQYRTTERYVAYQNAFAKSGYITYKSDYRGHGSSQGESGSSRGTPDYTIDVMNALSSVARHPDADPNRIGMWGHSMGGLVTLKSMVISDRIKAGVIWAGVVASYPDLYNRLGEGPRPANAPSTWQGRRSWRLDLVERFGTPEENPAAWDAVSPNAYLAQISGPLQLHHGTADYSVPVEYSSRLQEQMDAAGKLSETFIYEGDDHNLAGSLSTALARSVEFFDRHVKGEG